MNQKAPASRDNEHPAPHGVQGTDDLRYYLACPLRKGHPRIAVTVCHKQKCLWLTSDGGKLRCSYGDPNATK